MDIENLLGIIYDTIVMTLALIIIPGRKRVKEARGRRIGLAVS
jgi:hypothetical protein